MHKNLVYLLISLVLIQGCSHKPTPGPKDPTYRECVAAQDKVRENRFAEMPEHLRALAGKHTAVKYFTERPKNLAALAAALQKENAIFNARKNRDDENDVDLRLLDTSPGRNRVLIGFEKKSDFVYAKSEAEKLVFKMDYSKPVIGYFFPLSAMKPKGKGYGGFYSSTVKVNAPASFKGDRTFKKLDISIYVEKINDEYMYVEWVNGAYDRNDDENWKGIHAILFTKDDDKFLDWEHPYFDPKGELNPELCNSLEGG